MEGRNNIVHYSHHTRYAIRSTSSRGVTLLDTVVGTFLMLVVFLGIGAAFRLSIDVVISNKGRGGAIALADERMEYIHSLSYASIGTAGGVPPGAIPQSETVTLNGLTYTRRTVIMYADDPKDGLGSADQNHITSDYKAAKVDVAWASRTDIRHTTLVTRIDPPNGMETACTPPCGTLTVSVVNAASAPLSGASISITNASVLPAVNVSTFSDTSGTATLIGAPAGSGYSITVTEPGYSTAQTYSATSQNTNPNPGNLTVSNGVTTSGTFAIDVVGMKTVKTWTQILQGTWADTFSNAVTVATSTNISITGSIAQLASNALNGEVQSIAIAPSYLREWKTLYWTDAQTLGSSILYRIYDAGGAELIPDSQLPGNSAGFTTSPVDLSGVSTTTYSAFRLDAVLTPGTTDSPSIDAWSVDYDYGPQPLPDIAFTLQGAKTIGSGPGGPVYKYSQNQNSGSGSSIAIQNLEWDTYVVTVNGTSTNYDIASSCNPQPEALAPGQSAETNLYLAAHTINSLLVDVRAAASGALIPNASVHLYKTGYDTTLTADSCAQALFSGLASSNAYSISVSAPGYATYTASSISVAGTARLSVTLN